MDAAGSGYDSRSDVWSLGVILYELLSLRRPFPATSIVQLAIAISGREAEALPESVPADAARLVRCQNARREEWLTRSLDVVARPAPSTLPARVRACASQVELCLSKQLAMRPTAAQLLLAEPIASWAAESERTHWRTKRGKENATPSDAVEMEAQAGSESPREGAEQPRVPSKVARVECVAPLVVTSSRPTGQGLSDRERALSLHNQQHSAPVQAQPSGGLSVGDAVLPTTGPALVAAPPPARVAPATPLPPALAITQSFSSDEDDDNGPWGFAKQRVQEAWGPSWATPSAQPPSVERVESRGKKQTAARLNRHRRTASAPAVTAVALAQAAQAALSPTNSSTRKATGHAAALPTLREGGDSPFMRFRPTPTFARDV